MSRLSRTWSAYFDETHPEDYRFLDFYEYRSQQSDFTFSFQKESDKLKKDLGSLITNGSDKMKEGANLLNKSFKVKFLFIVFCMVNWQREASQLRWTTACCPPYGLIVRCGKRKPSQLRWTTACCLPYGLLVRCVYL